MIALLVIFLTAILVLFAGVFNMRSSLQFIVLTGLVAALSIGVYTWGAEPTDWDNKIASMLHFDHYAWAFSGVAILSTILITLLTGQGFRSLTEDNTGDYYGLLLMSLCGAVCMFSFTNLVVLFLGIEILSIPLYVLAGSRRHDFASNEAALKYYLMGAFATGILLFGMTLVYGATGGHFDIQGIAIYVQGGALSPLFKMGVLFILVGMSFKISAAPFHFWSPDVYEGSPNIMTVFMATVVKTAAFGAFFRLFVGAFGGDASWTVFLSAIAAMTMILANLIAINQKTFKRMMAYSSISHAGYLLLGILGMKGAVSANAILLYILVYSVATISAFAVYMAVCDEDNKGNFAAFHGLSKRNPLAAFTMTIAMITLAGIPPTAGFFGKYFLFAQAFDQYLWLVVIAIINSAISIYYYFRIIIAMYFTDTEEGKIEILTIPISYNVVMLLGLALIACLCIFPSFVVGLI